MPREVEYKRKLRNTIGGWSEAYEVKRGSGFGYPDLQFLMTFGDFVPVKKLVPVEVKLGWIKGDVLRSKRIRPSQIIWHDLFRKAGGVSFLVVCVGEVSKMDCWAVPSTSKESLAEWRKGWPLKNCAQWVNKGQKMINLLSLP